MKPSAKCDICEDANAVYEVRLARAGSRVRIIDSTLVCAECLPLAAPTLVGSPPYKPPEKDNE